MANILQKSLEKVKSWVYTQDGTLDNGWTASWWQEGKQPQTVALNPDVAAAISLYKRAITAVPTRHIVRNKDGAGIEVNADSPLSKVIHRPNQYMTWHELLGVIVDGLLRKGEFLLYIEETTDEDGKPHQTVHPINAFTMMSAEDGSIFYSVTFPTAARHLVNTDNTIHIPQRNVVHGRYEVDPVNPLRAMNPLLSYANSIGLGSALRAGQEAFHKNMSKPSGLLTTDQPLTKDQAEMLRSRWAEMSQRMKQGETPILSSGLKWMPTSVNANEAQAIQMMGLTTKDICKAYGIPSVLLGENAGVTYSNLEQLIYGWRTTGLLSLCKCIENAFEYSFGLDKNEEMVLDISDLARADDMSQAETLKGLVQNGIISPNEARARLDLTPMEGVANTLVSQQQIQPLEQSARLAQESHDVERQYKESERKWREGQAAFQQAQADAKPKETDAKLIQAEKPNSSPSTPSKETPDKESPKPEEPKKSAEPTVDLEALSMMLKGVFKS